MKTIAITGSSGFVGSHLKKTFEAKGFKVIGIQREDLKNLEKLTSIIEETHLLINLAGANIINRWTDTYKKLLYNSRIDTTKALIRAMSKAKNKPELFISTSAIGIYKDGNCYNEYFHEYDNNFLSNLCQTWEQEALKAKKLSVRTIVFRFGIVLGQGGALEKMITPFRLALGGTIGDGFQDFSFIHIDDLFHAYEFVYKNEKCEGIYNLTAPHPTTNHGFTNALGLILNRPTVLPIPKFVLYLLFGQGAEVLTQGQCIKPIRLLEYGFEFKYRTIEESLSDLVKEEKS